MVTTDYYYPDWGCLVDFFCNLGLKNCCPGIEHTTLEPSSQSGALWPLTHVFLLVDIYKTLMSVRNARAQNLEGAKEESEHPRVSVEGGAA